MFGSACTAASPISLTLDQVDAAAEILARAFFDDIGLVFACPDSMIRQATLPSFFAGMTHHALVRGAVHGLGLPLQAAALWIDVRESTIDPPGTGAPGRENMDDVLSDVAAAWGPAAMERFGVVSSHLANAHNRHMPEAHYYLFFLGVEPEHQGQGLGSALLSPMLERIEASGLPCYTDTSTVRNVTFYERLGFRVVERSSVRDANFPVWSLRRG